MKARAFAYNPSHITISGTTQVGDLAVGDPTSFPTGITFWNGADEDISYIICAPVSSGNQPTPLGNIGTVSFWRTLDFSDASFISKTNELFNQSFISGQTAKDWLNTNGYWTSWLSGITTGAVFYAKLDETSGDPIDNISFAVGTLSGTTTQNQAGKINNAVTFSNGGMIDFGNLSQFNLVSAATLSVWIYPTSYNVNWSLVIGKMDWANNLEGYSIALDGVGVIEFCLYNSTTYQAIYQLGGGVALNTWTHILCEWDSSMKIYVNGNLNRSSIRTLTPVSNLHNFQVAKNPTSPTSYFIGRIDEIGLWNRALTEPEITTLYNSGSGLTYPFL